MSHSYVRVWIHGVFGTKNRESLIPQSFESKLYDHLRTLLITELNCGVEIINGVPDHIHLLFLLRQDTNIAKVFKQLKGNSSHWINENRFLAHRFEWQVGYSAFSISRGHVDRVRRYIENQKAHHQVTSYEQELDALLNGGHDHNSRIHSWGTNANESTSKPRG